MSGLKLNNYKAIFVDMDGVVVMSSQLIPGSPEAFLELRNFGDVFILSNNSTRTREQFADNLVRLEIEVSSDAIINSAFVLAKYLIEQKGPRKLLSWAKRD